MPKVVSRKGAPSDGPVLGAAPKAKPASRSSGRIRSLSAGLRVVDEETRRAAHSSRLELYEADNYGDDGTGATHMDEDEEFFVDDYDTATKSRSGTSDISLGKQKSAASNAATLKKLREKRARARKLAEVIGEEAGLLHAAMDAATGIASISAIKSAVLDQISKPNTQNTQIMNAPGGAGREMSIPVENPAVKYVRAGMGAPRYPSRHICSECGSNSKYTCTRCGARFCTQKCGDQHKETRCLSLT